MKRKKDAQASSPQAKKQRNDVRLRLEGNKNKQFTSIKASWKSVCNNDVLAKTIADDIVPIVNTISFLSSKLMNFHYTRLLEGNIWFPEITQHTYYQACAMVSRLKYRTNKVDKDSELYESFCLMEGYFTEDEELPARDYISSGYIHNLTKMIHRDHK